MTKQFLVTVDVPDTGRLNQPDAYLLAELEAYAGALFEFHTQGLPPQVKVRLVNPLPHVLTDHER